MLHLEQTNILPHIHSHTLRHCYATHLLDVVTDIRYIQELLGHAAIRTTMIYTPITNKKISNIMSPLDQLMNKSNNNNKEKSGS